MSAHESVHIPILVEPILEHFLALKESFPTGGVIVDGTFGGGGHTRRILETLPENFLVLGLDRDLGAVENGKINLASFIQSGRLRIHHGSFGEFSSDNLKSYFPEKPFIGLLADLGFSSDQLEDGNRGISFLRDGPLDMRLDRSKGKTAYATLHELTETEMADMIFHYGEDKFARRIAGGIFQAVRMGNLPDSTLAFAALIEQTVPPKFRHGRIHAATRTFQALRIYVNDELEQLEALLNRVILEVQPKGRVAIISFHSLEDRQVKLRFKERESWFALTKKPLEADEEELKRNPRSRSAKLRIAERQ
jgi:16S rRNA (cytosine1402-N4)-methyltransferase